MAWCKLEDTFCDEPKFRRLAKRLGVEYAQAAGHVACLWSWATRHAPDGNLVTLTEDDIAHAAKWAGNVSEFVDTLSSEDIALLDKDGDHFEIHGFMKRAESRKAAQRQRKKRKKEGVSRAPLEPVTAQSRDCHDRGAEHVTRERRGEREERRGEDLFPLAPSATSDDGSPTPIGQVRGAWLAAYSAKYPTAKPYPWGARESGQAKNLLKSLPLAEVLELIPRYFVWPNAKAIRAGHPWGTGPDCFVLRFIELRADMADPERRKQSAVVDARMKQLDTIAQDDDMLNRMRIQEQHTKDPFDDRHWQRPNERRGLEQTSPGASGALEEGRDASRGDARAQTLASGDHRVVSSAGTVRGGATRVEGVSASVRSGPDAVDRIVQNPVSGSPGASPIRDTTTAHRGPTKALGPGSNHEHAVARPGARVDGE